MRRPPAGSSFRSWCESVFGFGWDVAGDEPLRPELGDAGAVGDAVLARRRRDDRELLAQRVRLGTLTVVVVVAVVGIAVDPFVHRPVLTVLLGLKLLLAVTAVWLWRGTHDGSQSALVGLTAAWVVLVAAVTSASSVVVGEYWSSALFCILLVIATAGLLPWGVRAQLVTAPLVLLLGLLPVLVLGPVTGGGLLTVMSIMVTATSVVIAWEQERYRREAWQRLVFFRENMDRLRQIAEHLNAVLWLGERGTWGESFLYVSPRYETVWGRERSTLQEDPRAWLAAVHPDDRAQVERVLRDDGPAGRWRCEYRLVQPDGRVRWIRDEVFPIRDVDGAPRRTARLSQDVTAERAAAQALRMRDLARGIQATREEERRRIARELHDELGQALTGIKLQLAGALGADDPARIAPALQRGIREIDAAMFAVHGMIHRLHPPILDDLGLLAALRMQGETFTKRTGVPCALELPDDEPALTEIERTTVFRVAQESLTNVARHAQASHVTLRLAAGPASVELSVADDGRGIGDAAEGFGLRGMSERAALLDGTLHAEPAPGGGTVVHLILPRRREENAA